MRIREARTYPLEVTIRCHVNFLIKEGFAFMKRGSTTNMRYPRLNIEPSSALNWHLVSNVTCVRPTQGNQSAGIVKRKERTFHNNDADIGTRRISRAFAD